MNTLKTDTKTTCPAECMLWARVDPPNHPATNHHPNCPHVDESLITVWNIKLNGDGGGFFTDSAIEAEQYRSPSYDGEGFQVMERKMHKEVFDRMPEFQGF